MPPNAGSEEKQSCKTIGKENKALPTPLPTRIHVFGGRHVKGPRELLQDPDTVRHQCIWVERSAGQSETVCIKFRGGPKQRVKILLSPSIKAN